MIYSLGSGWITLDLEGKHYSCSYLESTPLDILRALTRSFQTNDVQVVKLDMEEDGIAYLVFDSSIYVIETQEGIYRELEMTRVEFATKFLNSLDLNEVTEMFYFPYSARKTKRELKRCVRELKKELSRYGEAVLNRLS